MNSGRETVHKDSQTLHDIREKCMALPQQQTSRHNAQPELSIHLHSYVKSLGSCQGKKSDQNQVPGRREPGARGRDILSHFSRVVALERMSRVQPVAPGRPPPRPLRRSRRVTSDTTGWAGGRNVGERPASGREEACIVHVGICIAQASPAGVRGGHSSSTRPHSKISR